MQSDVRAFRWDPVIIHWAMTLQYHGGEMVIDAIRGKSTQGKHYQTLHNNLQSTKEKEVEDTCVLMQRIGVYFCLPYQQCGTI